MAVARFVVGTLGGLEVVGAVDFDDEAEFIRQQVGDIAAEGRLGREQAGVLALQGAVEQAFAGGGSGTHPAGEDVEPGFRGGMRSTHSMGIHPGIVPPLVRPRQVPLGWKGSTVLTVGRIHTSAPRRRKLPGRWCFWGHDAVAFGVDAVFFPRIDGEDLPAAGAVETGEDLLEETLVERVADGDDVAGEQAGEGTGFGGGGFPGGEELTEAGEKISL